MYVGLKQLRGDGERYVTPAREAAKFHQLRRLAVREKFQETLLNVTLPDNTLIKCSVWNTFDMVAIIAVIVVNNLLKETITKLF